MSISVFVLDATLAFDFPEKFIIDSRLHQQREDGYEFKQAFSQESSLNLLNLSVRRQAAMIIKCSVSHPLILGNILVFSSISILDQHIHLRFFQEFRGEDTSDLFLLEREAELKKAHEEKRQIQLTVPGLINPHDVPEEMQD